MMLTRDRAEKLQRILSKRLGRHLSEIELESAHKALVEFAVALVDLMPDESVTSNLPKDRSNNLPIAITS